MSIFLELVDGDMGADFDTSDFCRQDDIACNHAVMERHMPHASRAAGVAYRPLTDLGCRVDA
ncbi:hypothetical protein D3C86_1965010 [compost metagenome]